MADADHPPSLLDGTAAEERLFPGEAGRLIRARDWSASAIGPIDGWSRALKGNLSLLLAARVPIALFWGPDYLAFYNDAYAPIIGTLHPEALGRPAREGWRSAWDGLRPILDRVRAGESISARDRPIQAADAGDPGFFDISASPVFDSDGTIGGVIFLLSETTDRVRAERRLLAERTRLTQMFEQAPGFMAMLREPGHVFEFTNAAFQQLIGDRSVIGLSVAEALPETVGQGIVGMLEDVVRSRRPFHGRNQPVDLHRPDGSVAHLILTFVYQPIVEEDGHVSGIFVEGTDVTDRVQAEARLSFSEDTLRLAIEVAEVGTWDWNVPAGTLVWNDKTKAMFGLRPDETAEMNVFHAGLHPDDREATTAALAAALDPAIRSTYDVEYRTIGRHDGAIRWVAAKGRGLFDADGTCVRAIGTAVDITARRQAEQTLRESEERFRIVADSAPALIWMCDAAGALIFANRWHEEMFGRPVSSFFGNGWQSILHPDDRAGFVADFTAALAARRPFGRDVRIIDRDGATRWLRSEALPRDGDGQFVGYVGCDVDISDARRAAEELERIVDARTGELAAANRRLSDQIAERERVEATLAQMQRLEAVGQLTSGVAHDFNNLLTVVLGNLDLVARAMRDAGLDGRVTQRLGTMRTAAERGAALTAQLLAFSRRQKLESRAIDLNETLSGMRELLQSSLGGAIRLETRLAAGLWPALVDPTQIELIVLNLTINARDAMPTGGDLLVETSNVTRGAPAQPGEPGPGDYVMIVVGDTGTGMTAEVSAKAFEPFFTTKPVGKGSGLGLAQVYGITTQSGGGVSLETAPDAGTTVRIFLPRAVTPAAVPPAPAEARTAPRKIAEGRRILLVDDDPPVREVTASALHAMGATVTEADSGAAALAALDAAGGAFDIMVADFAMPGMNGAELAAAATRRWPALPVLFVTGYADLSAIAAVSQDRIVQKPFRPSELQRKIAGLLRAGVGDA